VRRQENGQAEEQVSQKFWGDHLLPQMGPRKLKETKALWQEGKNEQKLLILEFPFFLALTELLSRFL
jgi:hypothetical protein